MSVHFTSALRIESVRADFLNLACKILLHSTDRSLEYYRPNDIMCSHMWTNSIKPMYTRAFSYLHIHLFT